LSIWLTLALISASLEVIAVSKNLRPLEYIAKPGVMVCLFLWLYSTVGLRGEAFWFGLGILGSLVGDILLLFPLDRMFLPGLVAFLVAHIFYSAGLSKAWLTPQIGSLVIAVLITASAAGLLRRIVGTMRARGEDRLRMPVIVYGLVISLMLHAALSTLFSPAWKTEAAVSIAAGAFLFWFSDLLLAWNKFVAAMKSRRIISILLYHLGQIGIIAGVVIQFG
jgi:uncharacterized membrane protein YhhN